MPKTQKELADLAGVSIVTVYNAIHRPEKVRPETREQIFRLMKQYDYLPDAVARSMVRGKTNIVGIIVPTIEVRYYARAIGLMEAELNQAGYRVLISQHRDDPEKEARELSLMREYRVDGIDAVPVADHGFAAPRNLPRGGEVAARSDRRKRNTAAAGISGHPAAVKRQASGTDRPEQASKTFYAGYVRTAPPCKT